MFLNKSGFGENVGCQPKVEPYCEELLTDKRVVSFERSEEVPTTAVVDTDGECRSIMKNCAGEKLATRSESKIFTEAKSNAMFIRKR